MIYALHPKAVLKIRSLRRRRLQVNKLIVRRFCKMFRMFTVLHYGWQAATLIGGLNSLTVDSLCHYSFFIDNILTVLFGLIYGCGASIFNNHELYNVGVAFTGVFKSLVKLVSELYYVAVANCFSTFCNLYSPVTMVGVNCCTQTWPYHNCTVSGGGGTGHTPSNMHQRSIEDLYFERQLSGFGLVHALNNYMQFKLVELLSAVCLVWCPHGEYNINASISTTVCANMYRGGGGSTPASNQANTVQGLYFETQISGFCLVHSINNLLQYKLVELQEPLNYFRQIKDMHSEY